MFINYILINIIPIIDFIYIPLIQPQFQCMNIINNVSQWSFIPMKSLWINQFPMSLIPYLSYLFYFKSFVINSLLWSLLGFSYYLQSILSFSTYIYILILHFFITIIQFWLHFSFSFSFSFSYSRSVFCVDITHHLSCMCLLLIFQ